METKPNTAPIAIEGDGNKNPSLFKEMEQQIAEIFEKYGMGAVKVYVRSQAIKNGLPMDAFDSFVDQYTNVALTSGKRLSKAFSKNLDIVSQYANIIGKYGMRLGKGFLKNFDIVIAAASFAGMVVLLVLSGNLDNKQFQMDAGAYMDAKFKYAIAGTADTVTLLTFVLVSLYRRSPDFQEKVKKLTAAQKARLSSFIKTKLHLK